MAKKSVFYKIYFSFIALFLIALAVLLFLFNGWLKGYEAAQPINIINGIVDSELKSGNEDYLIEKCALKISPYESKENLKALFGEQITGKDIKVFVSSKMPQDCDLAYVIKADGEKILYLYLKKQKSSNALLPTYEIVSSELEKNFYKTINITMPKNVDVTINGVTLDNAVRKDIEISQSAEGYLNGKEGITQQTATVDNLISENVLVAASVDGKAVDVEIKDGKYTVMQYIDPAIKNQIALVATEGSKAYAGYMQGDATLEQVAAYFNTGCEFYKNIRSSYTSHILEHTPAGFDSVKNDEFFQYSDNIYSCHVSFTQVLKRNGMTYKIYFDKNVFVEKSGGGFRIIDIKSPEEK